MFYPSLGTTSSAKSVGSTPNLTRGCLVRVFMNLGSFLITLWRKSWGHKVKKTTNVILKPFFDLPGSKLSSIITKTGT